MSFNKSEFSELLRKFDHIIEQKSSLASVEKQLNALSEEVSKNSGLTGAQKRAIVARCKNYLEGTHKASPVRQ